MSWQGIPASTGDGLFRLLPVEENALLPRFALKSAQPLLAAHYATISFILKTLGLQVSVDADKEPCKSWRSVKA